MRSGHEKFLWIGPPRWGYLFSWARNPGLRETALRFVPLHPERRCASFRFTLGWHRITPIGVTPDFSNFARCTNSPNEKPSNYSPHNVASQDTNHCLQCWQWWRRFGLVWYDEANGLGLRRGKKRGLKARPFVSKGLHPKRIVSSSLRSLSCKKPIPEPFWVGIRR